MNTLLAVAGTRPEAIKLATVIRELRASGQAAVYLWTNQHASDEMAGDPVLRAHPSWPLPDGRIDWADDAPARIVAWWTARFPEPPRAVLVQGDTRSALAGALAASHWPDTTLVHLEAGLRSWLPDQVEETIRRRIDRAADLLLCPSPLSAAFARVDARPEAEIAVVGQTGLDALLEVAATPDADLPEPLGAALLGGARWALLTLHRAELVDHPRRLQAVAVALVEAALAAGLRVVWALHPRVQERATTETAYAEVLRAATRAGARLVDPVPYAAMVRLLTDRGERPAVILTDSGGLVEDAFLVGIPTVIVRDATERWEALTDGPATLLRPDDAPTEAEGVVRERLSHPSGLFEGRFAYGRRVAGRTGLTPTARAAAAITRHLARSRTPEAA